MANQQVTARMPPDVLARIDALVAQANTANQGARKEDRGTVLRSLAVMALPLMEAQYRTPKHPRGEEAKPGKRARRTA